jgi:Domain of unknown function (DUF3597)
VKPRWLPHCAAGILTPQEALHAAADDLTELPIGRKQVRAVATGWKQQGAKGRQSQDIGSAAMSMFGSIMSSIFGSGQASPVAAAQALASPPQAQPAIKPSGAAGSAPQVDVAAIMDKLAQQSTQSLDWRHSIVDMMKLLKLDSSLAARKQLADELQFTGNKQDTAAMNIWLHKQVMLKLAENGGVVPAELKH